MMIRLTLQSTHGNIVRIAVVLTVLALCLSCASDDDGTGFLTVATLIREQGVIVERVSYLSGPLKIAGEICRPDDGARHPAVMWSHGGFNGIGALDRDLCQRMAEAGYVAGLSEYRGEGGSDGRIEFCLGEVDDVERLLEILTSQPYVDGARIAVLGASHGGCITTRLALRRPSLSAAVDYVGPGDLATLYDWWSEQLARGEPFCRSVGRSGCAEQHALYVAITTTALGGPPATKPEAYVSRSPIRDLAALRVPMLFIHGADDEIVGVEQACQKRSALETAQRPLQAWALDTQLQPNPAAALCGGRFRADIVPASLSDDLYLFLFERQGHNLSSSTIDYSWTLTLSFLASHL